MLIGDRENFFRSISERSAAAKWKMQNSKARMLVTGASSSSPARTHLGKGASSTGYHPLVCSYHSIVRDLRVAPSSPEGGRNFRVEFAVPERAPVALLVDWITDPVSGYMKWIRLNRYHGSAIGRQNIFHFRALSCLRDEQCQLPSWQATERTTAAWI